MKRNRLLLLISAFLFLSCQPPKQVSTNCFYVNLDGFSEEQYQYIAQQLFDKWVNLSYISNELELNTYPSSEEKPDDQANVHEFKDLRQLASSEITNGTIKADVTLSENGERFSVSMYKWREQQWVRVLNAGSFEMKGGLDYIIRTLIVLTYK